MPGREPAGGDGGRGGGRGRGRGHHLRHPPLPRHRPQTVHRPAPPTSKVTNQNFCPLETEIRMAGLLTNVSSSRRGSSATAAARLRQRREDSIGEELEDDDTEESPDTEPDLYKPSCSPPRWFDV